jgi:hypothetical protein
MKLSVIFEGREEKWAKEVSINLHLIFAGRGQNVWNLSVISEY